MVYKLTFSILELGDFGEVEVACKCFFFFLNLLLFQFKNRATLLWETEVNCCIPISVIVIHNNYNIPNTIPLVVGFGEGSMYADLTSLFWGREAVSDSPSAQVKTLQRSSKPENEREAKTKC